MAGALYFSQQALGCNHSGNLPPAPEYQIEAGAAPVILSQDGYGIYDETLNGQLRQVAQHLAASSAYIEQVW